MTATERKGDLLALADERARELRTENVVFAPEVYEARVADEDDRVLSRPIIQALVGFRPRELAREIRSGRFPALRQISATADGLTLGELRAWWRSRPPSKWPARGPAEAADAHL